MRICVLNSVHPADDTRVLRIARTLAEAAHDVTVVSPSGISSKVDLQDVQGNLNFVSMDKQARGAFQAGRSLAALLVTFLSRAAVAIRLFQQGWCLKADVYHCNEVDSWIVGIALKLLLRKRVVFDVHEYYPSYLTALLPSHRLRQPMERLLVWLFGLLSRLTDGAIFVNQSLADFYGFKCEQVVVRHCIGRHDIEGTPVDSDLKCRYNGHIVLLHVGSMRELYGANSLLEGMALLDGPNNVICVILGGVDNLDSFQRKLDNLGLTGRIEVIEKVPFQQVMQYLQIADIGLYLVQPTQKSLVYSLGRKFLEYVAAGLPVIASDFPEIRLLVEKYELGLLIDPEDPQDIARAAKVLAQNHDYRHRLAGNNRIAFEKELNWEAESQHLLDLYAAWLE
jgi:glycosyltransferase involved in cell wall biosynthesis